MRCCLTQGGIAVLEFNPINPLAVRRHPSVGSAKLDWRGFLDNDEINALILGHEFAGQMQAMLAADLAASQAIDLKSWERRPLSSRSKEWMARVWGRLL